MSRYAALLASTVLLIGRDLRASPIEIPVNTSASSVTVQLCVIGSCDTDVSPAAGFVELKLDSLSAPEQVQVYDFVISLTEIINLFISYGIFGNISATGQNVSLEYAAPGTPLPPAPLGAGGAFAYIDVPAISNGVVNYTATGLPCSALMGSGLPCTDTIVLADQGVQNGSFSGAVTVLPGRVVQMTLNPSVSGPIDPANPSLGTLTITGNIVGQAVVPLPGDANLDGTVNGRDVQAFTNVLLAPGAFGWQARFAADMDDDDDFDADDAALFVDCLVNGACPN